jgi:hypothetical protein
MSYVDVELSSLPARINLYLNSVNRTVGDSPSSFEMTLANTLVTADTNEIFFMNVIQFNTFNNFYQVQNGYNTDFKIILVPITGINQTIKGTIPYGNLTVLDVLNYLHNQYSDSHTRTHEFGSMSCEMLSRELLERFECDWVECWEDNENGARIERI